MNRANRIEFERNEMSEIIAQNFKLNDEQYDPSDFEWSAHCLQMEGYHKKREDGKYIRLEDLQQFPIRKDHYDKEHGCEHFIFGVESVIEYAENLPTYDASPKSEWISVDERLPEKYNSVLIFCEGEVRIDYIDSYGSWHDNFQYRVNHWMPLPEAPKKGGAE